MNQLMSLYALNRAARHVFRVDNAVSESEATVYMYDMIVSDDLTAEWCGGISPMMFLRDLASITAPTIHLRINSPGGDVFAARAIEQAIRDSDKTIICHIDGICASAATFIAIACDEVVMSPGALFMIHNGWTWGCGDRHDMTKTATLLGKVDSTIALSYATKSGKPQDEIALLMDAETWFTAQEAVAFGLVDRIAGEADAVPPAMPADPEVEPAAPEGGDGEMEGPADMWNLSVYRNAPRARQQKARRQAPRPAPAAPAAANAPDFYAMARRLAVAAAL